MAAKKKAKTTVKGSKRTRSARPPIPPPTEADEVPPISAGTTSDENKPKSPGPPVAGIGESAGGLEAFKKFFTAMPADSGVAFVLVPHLDPKHESLTVELLTRDTKMTVVEATDGMAVEANRVHIIPPNTDMTIAGGVLHLTGPVERGSLQTSIDLFLRSLAIDKQEKAICIILSGTGSHGALGLKAVKAADGMAMVQDPNTADFPKMPQSASATGLMIEELQSANEELETSKEELQSLNEELNTVNNQLQDKVADLETVNNDMVNLLNCTEVAIIFLDTRFRIKRFTPPATRLFNLIATDQDRPISDITPKYTDPNLQHDLETVLRTLTPQETQVQLKTSDGCSWNRRIAPYRTVDNRIEGVVLTFTDVTQIRRAADQAQRLAAVLMDSNDAVIVHDFDGKITAWNRGAERMTGYSESEAFTMNIEQIIPDELRDKVRSHWDHLRRGERVDSWEAQRRTKDGRLLDVWVTATAIKDELGRFVSIAKTERDITELKQARLHLEREVAQRTSELRASEELLRLFIDHAPVAIAMFDTAMRYLAVSRRWNRDYAIGEQDIIGKSHYDIFPEISEDWKAIHRRALIGEVVQCSEERFVRLDGTVQWLQWEVRPWTANAAIGGILIFSEDISARKKAESALKESNERLRAILHTAADAIITIDPNGSIQSVNSATERMFDYTSTELIGRNIKMLMPPPYREEHDGYLAEYLRTGVKKIIGIGREVMAQRKDGSTFPIELAVSEVDHLQLFTGILRDISRRKELEREVVEIAALEQKRIGQMLHDDVGQELTALGLLTDGLRDELKEVSPDAGGLADKIERRVKSALQKVRSLARGLDVGELDSGELPEALAEMTTRLGETSGMKCAFQTDQIVPILTTLQATHLYHIVQEACTNVLKHTKASRLEVSLQTVAHSVILSVRDDGIGIGDAQEGLGQRIMRNRARLIGAKLTVESTPLSGTVVTCILDLTSSDGI